MSIAWIPRLSFQTGKAAELAGKFPIQDALKNQPKTEVYFFGTLVNSPDTIVGLEVYTDKDGIKAHGAAESTKTFFKAATPLFTKQVTIDAASPVCGFLSKETESAADIIADRKSVLVFVTIICRSPEDRRQFMQHATAYSKEVEKEAGTLSYYWSVDSKDPAKIHVFERYVDQAAVKVHHGNATSFLKTIGKLVKHTAVEQATPIGGFLKVEPSLMESSKL